ncbi:hypothetical protein [Bradyrhizobium sp. DASA03120]|uniref:hypothetical protein n=1 Tax=Bradyrhizobium sp. SMVTL-02 TaxID=3395917 RepID=UPI003F6F0132
MSKRPADSENQTKCWTSTDGHTWMRGYVDTLSAPVGQRLRQSPLNLCPACLVTEFLPRVQSRHHVRPLDEKALFAAIEVMEMKARCQKVKMKAITATGKEGLHPWMTLHRKLSESFAHLSTSVGRRTSSCADAA